MEKEIKKAIDPMALLEWEFFGWPLDFSHLKCLKGIYDLPSDANISLHRGENYKLTGSITGSVADRNQLEYKGGKTNPEAGDIMETEHIIGSKTGRETIDVKGALLVGSSLSLPFLKSDSKISFNVQLITYNIDYTENDYTLEEVDRIHEFYLCGQIQLLWPGSTRRLEVTKTAKIRLGIDEEIEDPVNIASQSGGSSGDFFVIDTEKYFVIVQQAHREYLPAWANGVILEYRRKDRAIPSEDDRKAISEITSFVLGTQLMKVGESHLDESDIILKKMAFSPWGDNIIAKCGAPARPPIRIGGYEEWGKVQNLLNLLVPAYIEKRSVYNLKDVLWKYWIATELAIGTNLPILSSGLETLAESYVKANSLAKTYTKQEKKLIIS